MESSTLRKIAQIGVGILIAGAGVAHFTHAEFFIQLVPDGLDAYRGTVNTATAVLMIAMGVAFFVSQFRAVACWSSIILLVITLPSAIDQVIHPEAIQAVGLTTSIAALRAIAQLVAIVLIWWATQPDQPEQGKI